MSNSYSMQVPCCHNFGPYDTMNYMTNKESLFWSKVLVTLQQPSLVYFRASQITQAKQVMKTETDECKHFPSRIIHAVNFNSPQSPSVL